METILSIFFGFVIAVALPYSCNKINVKNDGTTASPLATGSTAEVPSIAAATTQQCDNSVLKIRLKPISQEVFGKVKRALKTIKNPKYQLERKPLLTSLAAGLGMPNDNNILPHVDEVPIDNFNAGSAEMLITEGVTNQYLIDLAKLKKDTGVDAIVFGHVVDDRANKQLLIIGRIFKDQNEPEQSFERTIPVDPKALADPKQLGNQIHNALVEIGQDIRNVLCSSATEDTKPAAAPTQTQTTHDNKQTRPSDEQPKEADKTTQSQSQNQNAVKGADDSGSEKESSDPLDNNTSADDRQHDNQDSTNKLANPSTLGGLQLSSPAIPAISFLEGEGNQSDVGEDRLQGTTIPRSRKNIRSETYQVLDKVSCTQKECTFADYNDKKLCINRQHVKIYSYYYNQYTYYIQPSIKSNSFENALRQIEAINEGTTTHQQYRLPTIIELYALSTYIRPQYQNYPPTYYWSSTPLENDLSNNLLWVLKKEGYNIEHQTLPKTNSEYPIIIPVRDCH
ncbi:hypothetical protein TI03_00265 [Achromatium sp. WMS1]|nr:hypothetical protein TI03_00265 [Achromatium sp. WMS1]